MQPTQKAVRLISNVISSTIHGASFYGLLNKIIMFKKTFVKIGLLAGVSCFFLSIIAVSVWGGDIEASKAGMMAEKNGDSNRAIKLYTQAINSGDLPQKELALILYLRGNLFLARSEYNRTIQDASKAIELDPTGKVVAYAYHIRAGALSGIGQFDRAIKNHNKSIELKPEYANAYYSRALSWLKKGDKERALADFTKAINLKEQYAAAYRDRGNVWMEKGDSDRALSDYNKAIELDSRYALAYYSRGNFYIKKGDYDLAIKDSEKAVALNPEDSEAYANIGTAWLMRKSYSNAISNFTKAIQLNPNYADAHFNRCIAYAKSNQDNASLRDAKRFIQIAPNHPRASAMQEIVNKIEPKVSDKSLKNNLISIIIKSIGFGLISIFVGSLIALVLALLVGFGVEPIADKFLSEPVLKKFRHIWSYAWVGFTVGMINSALIYFFKMNGWILILIFIVYLVIFMGKRNTGFVLHELCAGDEKQFNKLSRTTETITFASHIIGLYGLWTIFMKWS